MPLAIDQIISLQEHLLLNMVLSPDDQELLLVLPCYAKYFTFQPSPLHFSLF